MKHFFNRLLSRKNGIKSVYAILAAVGFLIVVALNIVMGALADRYPLSIDLTGARLFELSNDTGQFLQSLDRQVSIRVLAPEERFVNTSVYNAQANEIMRQFARRADKIDIAYIDYESDPTFAARYPDLTMKQGDILVSADGRTRLVKTEELFNYTLSPSGAITIASSRAEEAILSAVLYVTSDSVPKAVVLTGHGETRMAAFESLLQTNNYDVAEGNLLTGQLDEDTDLVLLVAPTADLSDEEIDLLDSFLKNGGAYGRTLFYCASPRQAALPNLEAFLSDWGVYMGDGLVFETDAARVYSTQPFYAITDYASETYAELAPDSGAPMLVPVSRPLEILFAQQENYYTETLLQFGATTGVRPSDADESFTADDAVRHGPFPALVLCSRQLRDRGNAGVIQARSNVLVSGSSELLQSYAVGNSSFANGRYLISLLNTLCEKEETFAVTSKTIVGNTLDINQSQADRLGYLFVAGVPAVILLMGAGVWLSRRHK
ncbi:GldG family protein [Anaerotruncus colihominis]|uniref:GldG family protein n=1 Tax=Anaerotruncus colihominis TaxID=169435 RepID=UPI0026F0D3A1|nr:GldG family protein [Anaerotruncus colihominis]